MPLRMRDLTKYIAALLTIRFHPSLIQAGASLHRALFRVFRGAGPLGADTLILTTRGRITGRPRSTPLYYIEQGERLYVAGSFAGSDAPPDWYLNLLAHPDVDVEVRGRRAPYRARVLPEEAGKKIWRKLVVLYPPFARYQQRTVRHIPVIELSRAPGPVPGGTPTGEAVRAT